MRIPSIFSSVRNTLGSRYHSVKAYNKDPSPSTKTSQAVHLHKTIGEDTSKSRSHASDEVKDGISLLQLKSGVPFTFHQYLLKSIVADNLQQLSK